VTLSFLPHRVTPTLVTPLDITSLAEAIEATIAVENTQQCWWDVIRRCIARANRQLNVYRSIAKARNYQTRSPSALTLSWQDSCISKMIYKTSKLGQSDLVLGLWSEFISIGLCVQDYKYLCLAVMISVTLVNTQTHRQTTSGWLYY